MIKHWTRVFNFTFRQQVRSKAYIGLTLAVFLIFFIGISLTLSLIANSNRSDADKKVEEVKVQDIIVFDETKTEDIDWQYLNYCEDEYFDITYTSVNNMDDAVEFASHSAYSLVLYITEDEGVFDINVLLPDNSNLKKSDASDYGDFFLRYFDNVLITKANLNAQQYLMITNNINSISVTNRYGGDTDSYMAIKEALSYVIPFLSIFLLYFLILFYGQGVAASVLLEKTSKLMDSFLVSIKPAAMVLGKILAIASAGVLQFAIWVAGIWGGYKLGVYLCSVIAPEYNMPFITYLKQFGELGLFSPPAILLSIVIILAGFLMYCALSAIGGALAGRMEDLGNTNMFFSLILVVSFLLTMTGGVIDGVVNQWMCFIPFTAVLVVPGWALLGSISPITAAVAAVLTLAVTFLLALFAGKVYTLMSFYKGNPPSIFKLITMIKASGKELK